MQKYTVILVPSATSSKGYLGLFSPPTSCVFHMIFHYSTCRQPAKAILLFWKDTDSIFLHKLSSTYYFPLFSKFQKIPSYLFFLTFNILLFKREFGIEKYEQYSTSYKTRSTMIPGNNLLSEHVKNGYFVCSKFITLAPFSVMLFNHKIIPLSF